MEKVHQLKPRHHRQPSKDDRRTQRTKKDLAEALKELIIEKGYEAVTIQHILDRANVGRSTFYSHYENKEQLLVGNINFQEELVNSPLDDDEHYPMGVNLGYLFTKKYLTLGNAMFGTRSGDILFHYFREICARKISECKKARAVKPYDKDVFRYKAEAAAAGVVSMLFAWLSDGAPVSEAEIIACARQFLMMTTADISVVPG